MLALGGFSRSAKRKVRGVGFTIDGGNIRRRAMAASGCKVTRLRVPLRSRGGRGEATARACLLQRAGLPAKCMSAKSVRVAIRVTGKTFGVASTGLISERTGRGRRTIGTPISNGVSKGSILLRQKSADLGVQGFTGANALRVGGA